MRKVFWMAVVAAAALAAAGPALSEGPLPICLPFVIC